MDSVADWLELPDVRCAAHPGVAAEQVCYRCGGFLCCGCVSAEGPVVLCAACEARMTAVLLEPLARGAAWKLAFVPVLLLALAGWRVAHQQEVELPVWMALWALPLACAPAVLRWKLGGLATAAALFSLGLLGVQAVPVLLEAPTPTRVVDAVVLALAPAVAVVNGLRLKAAARTLAWLKAAS